MLESWWTETFFFPTKLSTARNCCGWKIGNKNLLLAKETDFREEEHRTRSSSFSQTLSNIECSNQLPLFEADESAKCKRLRTKKNLIKIASFFMHTVFSKYLFQMACVYFFFVSFAILLCVQHFANLMLVVAVDYVKSDEGRAELTLEMSFRYGCRKFDSQMLEKPILYKTWVEARTNT